MRRIIANTLTAITLLFFIGGSGYISKADPIFEQWHDFDGIVNLQNWDTSDGGFGTSNPPTASWPGEDGYQADNYLEFNVKSSYRKVSLALAVYAPYNNSTGVNTGQLSVYLNNWLLSPVLLQGGSALDSGWKKEYLVSNTLGIRARADGNDTIKIVASGDLDIAIHSVMYGDFKFCSVSGEISHISGSSGEDYALVSGEFTLLDRSGNSWRSGDFYNRVQHSNIVAQPTPFEYSITGIPYNLGPYNFSFDLVGHSTNNPVSSFTFTNGESKMHDFTLTVNDWCDKRKEITRPCTSIPEIVVWYPGVPTNPRFDIIIRDAGNDKSTVFNAQLISEYWTRNLKIVDQDYGAYIFNVDNPLSPYDGWKITAELDVSILPTGFKNYPEELYDLRAYWIAPGFSGVDYVYNSVSVKNGYYYENPGGDNDYIILHVTDSHLSYEKEGHLSKVIDDWNIVNPAFIIATGDNYWTARNWAINSVAWFEQTKDLNIPMFVCPGNHEYDTGNANNDGPLRSVVRQGWLDYHSQNLYAFNYDEHLYYAADDNLKPEESGYATYPSTLDQYIHATHVEWLSEKFEEIYYPGFDYDDSFICTFSHTFRNCDENANDEIECIDGWTQIDAAWSDVSHFPYYEHVIDGSIVDLHASGHTHFRCWCPLEETVLPNEWIGAVMDEYEDDTAGNPYGIHYISGMELDFHPNNELDPYFDRWDESDFIKADDIYYHPFIPGGLQRQIQNNSNWWIPEAKARFIVNVSTGGLEWEINTGYSHSSARIDQQYYSDDGTKMIVDCNLELASGGSTTNIRIQLK